MTEAVRILPPAVTLEEAVRQVIQSNRKDTYPPTRFEGSVRGKRGQALVAECEYLVQKHLRRPSRSRSGAICSQLKTTSGGSAWTGALILLPWTTRKPGQLTLTKWLVGPVMRRHWSLLRGGPPKPEPLNCELEAIDYVRRCGGRWRRVPGRPGIVTIWLPAKSGKPVKHLPRTWCSARQLLRWYAARNGINLKD